MIAVGKRRLAAAALSLLLVAGAALGLMLDRGRAPLAEQPPEQRPELMLLTSLPLVFPERFTLDQAGSPALTALERRYRVVPVSAADSASLSGKSLLLMAQPNAQTAEALVELDRWVRGGGRVVLLADPALEWPSEFPLGDLRRPPHAFADTGLLGHWGLRLDLPERRGPGEVDLDGRTVTLVSPGLLVATGRDCRVSAAGLVARCRIGSGRATVIADADFIDAKRRGESGSANLDALIAELERVEP